MFNSISVEVEEYEDEEESNVIELTEPQTIFTLTADKYPLFCAGFGSGKSLCMAVNVLNDLSYPNANVGVYAPTYDLLGLIIIPYLEELLTNNEIPYKYNKNSKIIAVEDHGDIICRSLDNPATIVGYQVFRSHIDELDTLKAAKALQAWRKVIARNRQKIYHRDEKNRRVLIGQRNGKPLYRTYLNRVSGYTTPEGFGFCYDTWEKNKEKNTKKGYVLVRASTYSNAHNLPDDYIDTLKSSYPPELVDAYIEGIFVNLVGGRCYPKFDRTLNHSDEVADQNETLYVGMDFNVMVGSSIIHVLRNGLPVAVDEIHNAYDTDEQITALREKYPRNPIRVYPDATGKNRSSSNTVETDIAKLHAAGFIVIENYSNPPIKDRVFSLSAMICNGKGLRRYKVNTNKCPEYTLCLEQQIWGSNGLPDKSNGLDHKPDAAGYYIYEEFPIDRPVITTAHVRGNY